MAMNVGLIRDSFNAIKPHALEVVEHFYAELFSKHPAARGLFKDTKMVNQQRALANSLSHIVEYLEDGEHLTDYLRKMGGRHVAYKTQPVHYEWVGEALLSTFAFYFDQQWTDELAENWQAAYGFIAKEMMMGMEIEERKVVDLKTMEPSQPTLGELASKVFQELIKKAMEEEMSSPAFRQVVQEQAKELLRNAIEAEAQAMLADTLSKIQVA